MSYLTSDHRFTPASYRTAPGYVYGAPAPAPAPAAPTGGGSGGILDALLGKLTGGAGTSTSTAAPTPTTPPAPTSSGWDKIWGSLKDIAAAGGKTAEEYLKAKGRDQAYQEALALQQNRGMPSWMMPALIGGGILLAVVLLRRK